MALDLSPPALLRAGTGLLACALGVHALLQRPATTRSRTLGAFLVLLGAGLAIVNLAFNDDALFVPAAIAASLAFGSGAVALAGLARAEAGEGTRALMLGGGVAALLTLASGAALVLLDPSAGDGLRARVSDAFLLVNSASLAAQVGVLVVMGARARVAAPTAGTALLAAALGILVGYNTGIEVTRAVPFLSLRGLLNGLGVATAAALWAASGTRRGRDAALALCAAGLAGIALTRAEFAWGAGVARIVALGCLAYGVFEHDLLGTGRAAGRAHRGALATGALAALFIVAEIAQSWLSTEYGLLLGGIVAGAVVLAAGPLQRALDARSPTTRRLAIADEHARETYRIALRAAMAQGAPTPAQEDHLADLAQHLGIGAGDARRLRLLEEQRAR